MEKNNPGLDMKHGFLHHIRRNQYKRDAYDKEIKTGTSKSKPEKQETTIYPDKQVYRPKGTNPGEDDNCVTGKPSGKVLYILEYTDNTGWVHKVHVHKDDVPKMVAKRLANAANVPSKLLETLEWKIQQDILKRDI